MERSQCIIRMKTIWTFFPTGIDHNAISFQGLGAWHLFLAQITLVSYHNISRLWTDIDSLPGIEVLASLTQKNEE